MLEYIELNVNPKRKKTGDCSTRALCQATNTPWVKVIEMQCEESKRSCYDPTSPQVAEALLERLGFVKMKKPFKPNGKTYCVQEMDELVGPSDIALVQVANHWVCVKGKRYIDIWDCGRKSVYRYFVKRGCTSDDLALYANGKRIRMNLITGVCEAY